MARREKTINEVEQQLDTMRETLRRQVEQVRQQRETLKIQESNFNQLKLQMLVKFDKIKYLQDNYNQSRPGKKPLDLSVELSQSELSDIIAKQFHVMAARAIHEK